MKILLVEDDAQIASTINKGLTEAGYEISVAPDGNIGLQMATGNNDYNLYILDIMLPGINGIELCRLLRQQKISKPILMLTALGTTENIVTGLDNGADDYLVKPFKFAELEARIRTLLRRTYEKTTHTQLKIDNLELDTDAKTVQRNGNEVKLTSTEYRLLEYMMKNQRKVISRMELLEHIWGVDFNMATNVVDVYVNYLRKKIDKEHDTKLIHTVIGMGYIMKES